MRLLGINAAFHDPAAAIHDPAAAIHDPAAAVHDLAAAVAVDGKVVAAAEERRLSRRKHGKCPVPFSSWELPDLAARWCPAQSRGACDLDAIAKVTKVAHHVTHAGSAGLDQGHRGRRLRDRPGRLGRAGRRDPGVGERSAAAAPAGQAARSAALDRYSPARFQRDWDRALGEVTR
jgi:hypothetical protein